MAQVEACPGAGPDVAVIGFAGRFPGARSAEEFWNNLRAGAESIVPLTDEELRASGVAQATLEDPSYVKWAAVLDGVDQFDAGLFGYAPREARLMDPQQRVFLECAWEAMEHAGYGDTRHPRPVGVFAGSALNTYLLYSGARAAFSEHYLPTLLGNDKDFLATRVSYKLNLTGPSVAVQTACSTSLVAVHFACQSLLNQECDMALAGGVSIRVPQRTGYYYREGGVFSADGHCRAFDAAASGTVFGSGAGAVVLKRLADALADGDLVHAVIKGSAVNNDGSSKMEFTAPSVASQAEAVVQALAHAGIDPETLGHVEAHGTGTRLGDPIEVAALSRAFATFTARKGFCALGSVKTNIGHMDVTAGVAGLIKTVLALEHRFLPASLHFVSANPEIDFAVSPFYVNAVPRAWEAAGGPRRAGVNSLGMGGTNAFVVVEEAPAAAPSGAGRPYELLPLSARSGTALDAVAARLAAHLEGHPEVNLADVAYTLQVGRAALEYRRVVVCPDGAEAQAALRESPATRPVARPGAVAQDVVFLFPGQGAQHVNMGRELYLGEPVFRAEVDRCAEILRPHLDLDLRDVLYPTAEPEAAGRRLDQTGLSQPALFTVEYALARLWMSWGISPGAMAGHSLGEYVAACLAGVFSLPDALGVVAARGRLMQALPGGAMLALPLPEEAVRPLLREGLALAAHNAPSVCIVAGDFAAVRALEEHLHDRHISCLRVRTSHAFHSPMMEPMLEPFLAEVGQVGRAPPRIPFLSNVTGEWITPEEVTDPRYWVRHARQTVRFAEGILLLFGSPGRALLEVGPGRTLGALLGRHPARPPGQVVLSSLPRPGDSRPELASLLDALGQLWQWGLEIDWTALHAGERRRRLRLPT
jgi:acyl transferase domain-containing protein